jgi:hypothetical protein
MNIRSRWNKIKKVVTDARTGERTSIVSESASGYSIWTVTKEFDDDVIRAKEKSRVKNSDLNLLRRAIDV